MHGHYNLGLVALSIAVAIIASYTALDLANRVEGKSRNQRLWIVAGAASMGCGIWSMHFIGMLAFELPIPVAYNLSLTALSLAAAVGVSALALFILRTSELTLRALSPGAVLMGIGISAMHYLGMAAMQMSPGIDYAPALVIASVLIAMAASFVALLIAAELRSGLSRFAMLAKLVSAGVMGFAIAGMHYTGMAAAHFAPNAMCQAVATGGLAGGTLAVVIGCFAMGIMSVTLILSALDGHFATRNARLVQSLQRATVELQSAQGQLVTSARKAGMAEIANSVLHNVGNVLNSVNVSAHLIHAKLNGWKTGELQQAIDILHEHSADLESFLTTDEKGQRLLAYLRKAASALTQEKQQVLAELGALTRSIDHIKDIVMTQQTYAGSANVSEPVQIGALIEDALRMNAGSKAREHALIRKDVDALPPVLLDKHLLLQILVNLISNAQHAVEALPDQSHEILLQACETISPDGRERLRIRVQDTGAGIAPEHMDLLFQHGFTTRQKGHGFGLHSCALAAKTMGGTLAAESAGRGQGATFTLDLPLRREVAGPPEAEAA